MEQIFHDESWAEEEMREREALAAWDHDKQWPSVQKSPLSFDEAKQFDSSLTVLGNLGHGGFGHVDKVICGSVCLARKRIRLVGQLRGSKIEDLQQEALTMRKLNHRHVVKLVEAYMPQPWEFCLLTWPAAVCDLNTLLENLDCIRRGQDDRDDVMSRLDALELNDLSAIKSTSNRGMDSTAKCPLDFLRGVLGCTARATTYCHLNGIRHLDIKPTNILLKANRVYLADFGVSKDVSGQEQTGIDGEIGTAKWRAPEQYSNSPSMQLSDIYSLGLVYLNIATVLYNIKLVEFDDALAYPDDLNRSEKLAVREQKLGNLLQKIASSTSETLVDLITNMISPTPLARLPANKINERLSILGGSNQIYYNECCKHPISWAEDANENLATISSLRVENEDLKKKITELFSREKIYEEKIENTRKSHEQDIAKQQVLFRSRWMEIRHAFDVSIDAKSTAQKELDETQKELDRLKLSHSQMAKMLKGIVKIYRVELDSAERAVNIAEDERSTMQRRVDELTSQNQELSNVIAAYSAKSQDHEHSADFSDDGDSF